MINFLHNFEPTSILFSLGKINVYWYGLFIVTGVLVALFTTLKLAKKFKISPDKVFDLGFWVIIGGIIGARIYHVFLEIEYYIKNPLNVFKVWEGGLAIHGAMLAGALLLFYFAKKEKINFWLLTGIITPGLVLAQAIGRWGNYFNQELFGGPTGLPGGIPINVIKRPIEHISSEYFHPTFLYESIGNLIIFCVLMTITLKLWRSRKKEKHYEVLVFSYLIMYSILRFLTEFIRIDDTYVVLGLRFPQIVSLLIIVFSIIFMLKLKNKITTSE